MKVVALILSTFVLALLCLEVQCQTDCGSSRWLMSSYEVDEDSTGSFIQLRAESSPGQSLQVFSSAGSATGL